MTQDLARSLVEQVRMMGDMTDRCGRPKDLRYNLHTVVLAHGVGRLCTRNRWPGIRRGRLKMCFQNATHLALSDRERYVYCEGYAVRPSLGVTVGLHAWVLDCDEGWQVIDPTWRDTAGSAYLGIPFAPAYLCDQLMDNKVYGLIDVWPSRYPVLRLDPTEYLHPDAAAIPRDFNTE